MSTDFELFKGKNLSDLFKDIYGNQVAKKKKISEQIDFVRSMIKTGGDLSAVGNILTDLIEASIKNDDQLVRLASVVQKLVTAEKKSESGGVLLTEEEKQQLLISVDEIFEETQKLDSELNTTTLEINKRINSDNIL
jgi:hypothetical protein